MSYLRQRDYDRVILDAELQQIINTDLGIQKMIELQAIAQAKAYVSQKYYTEWEFTDTNVYSQSAIYSAWNRVYLDFTSYDNTATYNIGALVSNGLLQYYCKQNGVTGTFDATKFYLLGSQYDIWYIDYPYPLFDMETNYVAGNSVYWFGKVYTAVQGTPGLNRSDVLDALIDAQVPTKNVFPDDVANGAKYWGIGVPYQVAAIAPNIPLTAYTAYSTLTTYNIGDKATSNGVLYVSQKNNNLNKPLTDITSWLPVSWVSGDNRDQLVLDAVLNLVVYDLQKRIMPDNISETRKVAYELAKETLKGLAHANINADKLVAFESGKGRTVSFGGITKNINVW